MTSAVWRQRTPSRSVSNPLFHGCSTFAHSRRCNSTSVPCPSVTSRAGGRHNMPPPPTPEVDLWPFDLESGVRVTCDVGYVCANFSLPKTLCSRLRPDVRDRLTDVRQTDVGSSIKAPYWGGGIINTETSCAASNAAATTCPAPCKWLLEQPVSHPELSRVMEVTANVGHVGHRIPSDY